MSFKLLVCFTGSPWSFQLRRKLLPIFWWKRKQGTCHLVRVHSRPVELHHRGRTDTRWLSPLPVLTLIHIGVAAHGRDWIQTLREGEELFRDHCFIWLPGWRSMATQLWPAHLDLQLLISSPVEILAFYFPCINFLVWERMWAGRAGWLLLTCIFKRNAFLASSMTLFLVARSISRAFMRER